MSNTDFFPYVSFLVHNASVFLFRWFGFYWLIIAVCYVGFIDPTYTDDHSVVTIIGYILLLKQFLDLHEL